MIPRFLFRLVWLALFIFVLLGAAACQVLEEVCCTALSEASSETTSRSTFQPWPADKTETWQSLPVVLEVYTGPGLTPPELAKTDLPKLVVYADGRVITTRHNRIGEYHHQRTVHEIQLSQGELCQLLWQIESNGFYRTDQSAYVRPGITDMGVTYITARAWLSKTISAYALDAAVHRRYDGEAPPELANTYLMLEALNWPKGNPFVSDQVMMVVDQRFDRGIAAQLWPFSDVSLKELAGKSSQPQLFQSKQAARFQIALNDHWQLYEEDGLIYEVYMRPQLPYEQLDFDDYTREPYAYATEPTTTLTCSPENVSSNAAQVFKQATPAPTVLPPHKAPWQRINTVNLPEAKSSYPYRSTIAVSQQGDIWVIEVGYQHYAPRNHRLVHFDDSGRQLAAYEELGGQPMLCENYALVALSDQSVILADICSRQVWHIDNQGQVLARWGELGMGVGQLNLIHTIVAAPDEQSIFVLDKGNRRVAQYGLTGKLLDEWTSDELGAGLPYGLAVGSQGEWYLIDEETHSVIVRAPDGSVRQLWVAPQEQDVPRSVVVDERGQVYIGSENSSIYLFDRNGQFLGQDHIPEGIVFTGPKERLYIANTYTVRTFELK